MAFLMAEVGVEWLVRQSDEHTANNLCALVLASGS
jgi:hypothetical protein